MYQEVMHHDPVILSQSISVRIEFLTRKSESVEPRPNLFWLENDSPPLEEENRKLQSIEHLIIIYT